MTGRGNPGGLGGSLSLQERAARLVLFLFAFLSVATTAGIVLVLIFETTAFFREIPLASFFLDTQWSPLFADKHFGIWALVSGTALTSAIAIAVALPLGILAAVYLAEFAGHRTRSLLKPVMEILAGVPTVVYGYFALTFVTPLLQKVVPDLSGFNSLSPGIVMGIMIMPIIGSLSEDAIFAVPISLKEAAYALGAGRISTLFRVTIPSAFSGITASVILGVSRAIGETMLVTIAAGQQPNFTLDPRVPIETMTAYIVQVSLGDTPTGTLEYRTVFAVGMTLFIFTMTMNIYAHRLKKRTLGLKAA